MLLLNSSFKLSNWYLCPSGTFFRPKAGTIVLRNIKTGAVIGNTGFDPDKFSLLEPEDFTSKQAKDWFKILAPFDKKLEAIPDQSKDEKAYNTAVEKNSQIIVSYVKEELAKNGFKEDSFEALISSTKAMSSSNSTYTSVIITLKKAFNKGKWAGFMEAVSLKVQDYRNLNQQGAAEIGITAEEFVELQANARKIGLARSGFGRRTATRDYILGESTRQKVEDTRQFNDWVRKNASELTKILALSISDIPTSYAPSVVGDFLADETNLESRKKMQETLISLQKQAVVKWRGDKVNFNLDLYLLNN